MNVYFTNMRIKDDKKEEALYLATVKLVNEIGFASSSVSKIAKEAGVSPATLYIYFKNKDDLLISTYLIIKREISAAILQNLDQTAPIRDSLFTVWSNLFWYAANNRAEFRYTEQFGNSPYHHMVNREELDGYFAPVIAVVQRGIEEKIIKNVSFDVLGTFFFYPAMILSNPNMCSHFVINEQNITSTFQLAWDAIKL